MATSIGKKKAKTGNRIVPKPKPEKKVRTEAKKATMQIMTYSIHAKKLNTFNILRGMLKFLVP